MSVSKSMFIPQRSLFAAAWLALACVAGLDASAQVSAAEPATLADDEDDAAPATPFWQRTKEGWFWQLDPPAPVKPKTKPTELPPRLTDQDRDIKALDAFKVQLERALNAATQNPSETNVARFLELWAQARRKASVLSDTATALAVRMPWIDSTFDGGRPTTPAAMKAFDSIQMQDRDQLLRAMSQSYGLYFFFRRNCAYCHLQAPALKQFQEKYGFTVFAVSLDGGTLPDFPRAVHDPAMAERVAAALGVPTQHFVVPAVVLAKPTTREVVPVGFGAMNMDEMADRIAMVVRVRDNGPGRASASSIAALTGVSPANGDVASAVPPGQLLPRPRPVSATR